MTSTQFPLSSLPTWALVLGGVALVAQLCFEIWALVDMLKRPSAELNLGGRKWLWAIIILGINWIGAILYLVAGRRPEQAQEVAASAPVADRADAAMDSLYGAPRDGESR